MTKSIFEYKDDQDWYLASFGSYNHLTCFGDDEAYEQYVDFFQGLTNTLDVSGFQLHVVKHSSDLRLVSFILDCLKEELGRDLVVTQHQGTLLVSEGDKLLYVHVPREGVSLDDFFGSDNKSDFGDVLLIATRNEGKTKEFRKLFGKLGIKVENLNDYPDLPEVAETGMTFEENARLKAETISKLTGKMVLSDDSGYPERLVVKLGDVIIAQTHGHLFGINFTWDKLDLWAQQEDADICLYGHLHVAAAWRNGKTVYINPGSISQPRGPIHEKLYAKVIINDAKIRVEYYTRDHELYSELTQEFER